MSNKELYPNVIRVQGPETQLGMGAIATMKVNEDETLISEKNYIKCFRNKNVSPMSK